MSRRDGWWGIAFVVGLLVVAATVSLPTATRSGDRIKLFYAAHRQLIVVQQILGALLTVLFVRFAFALSAREGVERSRRTPWLLLAGFLLAAAQLVTNLPPLILALSDPSPAPAHTLTQLEDLADAALFVSIAVFSLIAASVDKSWVRYVSLVVAALTFVRAIASPLGVTALDALAPIAFLALVLALSARMIVTVPRTVATRRGHP